MLQNACLLCGVERAQKGIPTNVGKSKSESKDDERKHEKHNDRDREKGKEHKKHKHCHKDISLREEGKKWAHDSDAKHVKKHMKSIRAQRWKKSVL
ncbi:hypothetical protein HHK36_004881 [Tetracentron sinense]|uniref:Uncharacterized protein n=1 Tax=Tetracentron sinense TaxID=13715 RepID=A0A835DQL4_TETSI|nr:hypothetical protein HHK36_004881 [Tetracentron sinense]